VQVAVARPVGGRLVGQFVGRVLVHPAPAPARDVRVDHDAPDVGVERGRVGDAVPGLVGLDERGLHQILGIGTVAGQRLRGS